MFSCFTLFVCQKISIYICTSVLLRKNTKKILDNSLDFIDILIYNSFIEKKGVKTK